MKKSTKKSAKKSTVKINKAAYTKAVLNTMCKCGAFRGDLCINTKTGDTRPEPHTDRVAMSAKPSSKKLSDNPKAMVDVPKKKSPKEKLTEEQANVVETILEKVESLGRQVEFVGPVTVGPIISTYRFFPLKRCKVAHLEAMSKDFAVALGAESVLVKRMPGETAVGVFVPNRKRSVVNFRDTVRNVSSYMMDTPEDKHKQIPLNFGIDSNGEPAIADLSVLPHLLIAGTTGGGKSTLLHAIVLSMGWTMSPKELKLIISDTKGVEFKHFQNFPHLLKPYGICNDVYSTMAALQWAIEEAQNRLDKFGKHPAGPRNINEYNQLVLEDQRLPYIVIIIDELADIMGTALDRGEAKLNAGKLAVVAGRARASGINVIASTQRPDVSQIKGAIKANFPARLTFRLPQAQDSKTILGTKGAESLMSRGDMLYMSSLSPELRRLHAPWTALEDVKSTVDYIVDREEQARLEELQKAQAQSQIHVVAK